MRVREPRQADPRGQHREAPRAGARPARARDRSTARRSPASSAPAPSRKPRRPRSGSRLDLARRAVLAGVSLGSGLPVGVMGVLNVSPESFHAGSVHTAADDLLSAALAMVEAGAVLIDVGARSTAPYLNTDITEEEERATTRTSHRSASRQRSRCRSRPTQRRPGPARAALDAGARVINDVSGLRDPTLASLVAERGIGVILMASPEDAERSLAAAGGAVGVEGTRSGQAAPEDARPDGAQSPRASGRVPRGRLDPDRAPRRREPPRAADEPVTVVNALLKAALKTSESGRDSRRARSARPGHRLLPERGDGLARVGCASAGGAGHARGDRAPTVRRRFEKILHWRDHRPGPAQRKD